MDLSRFSCFDPASVTTRMTPLLGMLSRVTSIPGKETFDKEKQEVLKNAIMYPMKALQHKNYDLMNRNFVPYWETPLPVLVGKNRVFLGGVDVN